MRTIKLCMICLGLLGAVAQAVQPISGNYAPGAFTGMKGAVTPPKGKFMIENGSLYYHARDFVDGDGNTRQTSSVDAFANRTVFGYVPQWDVLGGRYLPAVIVPFANMPIRPEPGSEKAMQMGDLILQPFALGWTQESWHYQVSYNLWLPTARFNAGASNNVGKGLFSHLFSGGVTWLQDAENPWATTLQLRYELLGEQRDTNIEPGDVAIIEGGTGKELFSGFDLGLTYYYLRQITGEKNSPAGTDTRLYRSMGLGPEVSWRPSGLPGFQASWRCYFEFAARNTSEGIFNVLSIAYLF